MTRREIATLRPLLREWNRRNRLSRDAYRAHPLFSYSSQSPRCVALACPRRATGTTYHCTRHQERR